MTSEMTWSWRQRWVTDDVRDDVRNELVLSDGKASVICDLQEYGYDL